MTGLYVHIPFCSALCPYCDFAVVVGREQQHRVYVEALVTELGAHAWTTTYDTLFIGGGTPSFVDPGLIADLLAMITVTGEATMEANPESVDVARATAWRAAGINRLSIGAQSFDDDVLQALGRTHSAEQIATAVSVAREAGFENLSVDLIFGGPGETDESWRASVERAIDLGPNHISCYALTIEERTPFGGAVARGTMRAPDDDSLADRYLVAQGLLAEAGMAQYEISNWGEPCQHNMNYWTQGDYLGVGIGAHSHRDGRRWWNGRTLPRYLADPAAAKEGEETLDDAARAAEWLSLRLRLTAGFSRTEAEKRLGHPLDLDALGDLLQRDGEQVRLTPRGMLLENEVAGRLLDLGS